MPCCYWSHSLLVEVISFRWIQFVFTQRKSIFGKHTHTHTDIYIAHKIVDGEAHKTVRVLWKSSCKHRWSLLLLLLLLKCFIVGFTYFGPTKKTNYDKQNLLMWLKDATDSTWHDLITRQLIISQHRSSFFAYFTRIDRFVAGFYWLTKTMRKCGKKEKNQRNNLID